MNLVVIYRHIIYKVQFIYLIQIDLFIYVIQIHLWILFANVT